MAGVNSQIPALWVEQFSTNVQLLLQQQDSRLRQSVMSGSHVGSQASPVDQFGPVNANIVENRYGQMVLTDAPTNRRWVFPQDYDVMQLVSSFDKLRLIIDPMSPMTTDAVYALNRAIDSQIISGLLNANYVGNNGTTQQNFLSSQVVGVQQGAASSTNYTVAKMRAAKKILLQNEVDLDVDQIFGAVNAVNHDTLLSEMQVVSTEFNDHPVMVDGKVSRFLGIDLIHTELLTTGTDDQSGTSTACPVWAKSGAYLGLWNDISTDIAQRKDLRGLPYQTYVYGTFGATRLEEKKVVQIWAH